MGEHKRNPTAIAAKNGTLSPTKKLKLSKRECEARLMRKIWDIIRYPMSFEKEWRP